MTWGCTPSSSPAAPSRSSSPRRGRQLHLSRRLRRRFHQEGDDRRGGDGGARHQSPYPRAVGRGLRPHRGPEPAGQAFPRRRHPQPPQTRFRGQPRLLRLRPDRRPQRPHQGPRRLVLRREHDGGRRGHRQERWLHLRRSTARRRPRLQGRRGLPHRHRHEGRHHPHRRPCRRLHRLHDAARAHRHPRQRRPQPRRFAL